MSKAVKIKLNLGDGILAFSSDARRADFASEKSERNAENSSPVSRDEIVPVRAVLAPLLSSAQALAVRFAAKPALDISYIEEGIEQDLSAILGPSHPSTFPQLASPQDEREGLEDLKQELAQLSGLSPDQTKQVLEAMKGLAQTYLKSDPSATPEQQAAHNALAIEAFELLAKYADASPFEEIKKLAPLYDAYHFLAQGDLESGKNNLEKIRKDCPEAEAILSQMEGDQERQLQATAFEAWGSFLDTGESIVMDQAHGWLGETMGFVDWVFRKEGTHLEDLHAKFDLQRDLLGEVQKRLKRGEAKSFKEGIEQISAKGPEKLQKLAKEFLRGMTDPCFNSSWTLEHFVRYLSNPKDTEFAKRFLEDIDQLSARGAPPNLAASFYSVVLATSADGEVIKIAQEKLAELKQEKGFVDIAKDMIRTTGTDDLVQMAFMAGASKIGAVSKLATLGKLQNLGVTGYKALVLAGAAETAAEGTALWAMNTLHESALHDVHQVFTAEHLLKSYGSNLIMIGGLKVTGTLGQGAAPRSARALGLVAKGGAELSTAGKALNWSVQQAFGLGGMVGTTQLNQAVGLSEKPQGGFKESFAHDVLSFIKYGIAQRHFDHALGEKWAEKAQTLHEGIALREAELLAESALQKMGNKAKARDAKGAPIFGNAVVQNFYRQLVNCSLSRPGFSAGKIAKLMHEGKIEQAEKYLNRFALGLECKGEQVLGILERPEPEKISLSNTSSSLHESPRKIQSWLRDLALISFKRGGLRDAASEKKAIEFSKGLKISSESSPSSKDRPSKTSIAISPSGLVIVPEQGADLVQIGGKILSEERRIPNQRIVFNTQAWESPIQVSPELRHELQKLAEKSQTTISLKIPSPPYAVEFEPAAKAARDAAQGPLAAMAKSKSVDLSHFGNPDKRWPMLWEKYQQKKAAFASENGEKEFYRFLGEEVGFEHPLMDSIIRYESMDENPHYAQRGLADGILGLKLIQRASPLYRSILTNIFEHSTLYNVLTRGNKITDEVFRIIFASIEDPNPYLRLFGTRLISYFVKVNDGNKLDSNLRKSLIGHAYRGLKDENVWNVENSWRLLHLLAPSLAKKIKTRHLNYRSSTALRDSPRFKLLRYVYEQGKPTRLRHDIFFDVIQYPPRIEMVSIRDLQPIHSLADYQPDPAQRSPVMANKLRQLKKILKATGNDREKFLKEYFRENSNERWPPVMEIEAGKKYLMDHHHRLAALLKAAKDGVIPAEWVDQPLPVRLYTTYRGEYPAVLAHHFITLGVDLTWNDLFPAKESASPPPAHGGEKNGGPKGATLAVLGIGTGIATLLASENAQAALDSTLKSGMNSGLGWALGSLAFGGIFSWTSKTLKSWWANRPRNIEGVEKQEKFEELHWNTAVDIKDLPLDESGFKKEGDMWAGRLARPAEIQGLYCYEGFVYLHENNTLAAAVLAADQDLPGNPYRLQGARGTRVYFYPNGYLRKVVLAEPATIEGVHYPKNCELYFDEQGKVDRDPGDSAG